MLSINSLVSKLAAPMLLLFLWSGPAHSQAFDTFIHYLAVVNKNLEFHASYSPFIVQNGPHDNRAELTVQLFDANGGEPQYQGRLTKVRPTRLYNQSEYNNLPEYEKMSYISVDDGTWLYRAPSRVYFREVVVPGAVTARTAEYLKQTFPMQIRNVSDWLYPGNNRMEIGSKIVQANALFCDGNRHTVNLRPNELTGHRYGEYGLFMSYACENIPKVAGAGPNGTLPGDTQHQRDFRVACLDFDGTWLTDEKACPLSHGHTRKLATAACDEEHEKHDSLCKYVIQPKLKGWNKTQVNFAYLYAEDRNVPVLAGQKVESIWPPYTTSVWNNPTVNFIMTTSNPYSGNGERNVKIGVAREINANDYFSAVAKNKYVSPGDPLPSAWSDFGIQNSNGVSAGNRYFRSRLTKIDTDFLANGDINIIHRVVSGAGFIGFPNGSNFEPTCNGKHQIHVSRPSQIKGVAGVPPDLGAFRLLYMCYTTPKRETFPKALEQAFAEDCVGPSALYHAGSLTCSLNQETNRKIINEACRAAPYHVICKNILQPALLDWILDEGS